MKPAVLRPCARSRSRCSIGNRTSACVPDKNIRFASSRYLSSSPTSINAIASSPSACVLPVVRTGLVRNSMHRFCYACTAPFHGCKAYLETHGARRWPLPKPRFFVTLAAKGSGSGMTSSAFVTEISERDNLLFGPWRRPAQMLHAQVYDSHASIHDDATAQKLGFQGGTIEGPTHFSQFPPLCEKHWGQPGVERRSLTARH